jgi:SAM-dependent methyltransferase
MDIKNLQRRFRVVRSRGIKWLFNYVFEYFSNRRVKNLRVYSEYFLNKSGIEIGGPSDIFKDKGEIPLYGSIKRIDNVNYSTDPFLYDKVKEGLTYNVNRKKGRQFIKDTVKLDGIVSGKYDFVLSSHVLEHVANPIRAIREWSRILKKNGVLLVVLPEKKNSFDYFRKYTSLKHIILDFKNKVNEDDQTHTPEVLKYHDIDMCRGVENKEQLKEIAINVLASRGIHHHVFSMEILIDLMKYCGFTVLNHEFAWPFHNIVLCRK